MNIHGYSGLTGIGAANQITDSSKASNPNGGFAEILKNYTQEVNHSKKVSGKAAVDLATGKGGNTSETLLAIQKADVSFQMMMGVRNKLVDAYREISRMQV